MSQDSARRMVSFQQESTNLSQAYFSIVTSLCLSLVTRLCKTPMGHFGWNCHKIILLMSQAYKMSTDCRLWNHYCHRIFHSLCLWQDMSQIFRDFSHRVITIKARKVRNSQRLTKLMLATLWPRLFLQTLTVCQKLVQTNLTIAYFGLKKSWLYLQK